MLSPDAASELTEQHGWDGFFTWGGISVGPMPTWDLWVTVGEPAGLAAALLD